MTRSKGIRIKDSESLNGGSFLTVSPKDILKYVSSGSKLHWALFELEASGDLGEDKSMPMLMQDIESSKNGYLIDWKSLLTLCEKFWEVIWFMVIGCKDKNDIAYYNNDVERYTRCDIVVEVFDGSCCEVFSKDHSLIDRLANTFNDTEFLTPDWNAK